MNFTHHHLVSESPWPLKISFGAFSFATGFISFSHGYKFSLILTFLGLGYVIFIFALWTSDIQREATYLGEHSMSVRSGLSNAFLLFMVTEIFFFSGFIWAYLYSSLSPTVHMGATWPPMGIEAVTPWSIPLLNTLVLLTSGATGTWSHNALLAKMKTHSWLSLVFTIILAITFTCLQGIEYMEAAFTLTDSSYGTVFFSTLTLHGFHVIMGGMFLYICLISIQKSIFSSSHHIGFESALIMWHVVDAIWLLIFSLFYCWAY